MRSALELIFTLEGTAVLEEDGEQVWSSDDDEDFQEEVGNDLLNEEDATIVLEYLQETDHITSQEATGLVISVEDEDGEGKGHDSDDGDVSDVGDSDVIDAEFVEIPDHGKNTRARRRTQ